MAPPTTSGSASSHRRRRRILRISSAEKLRPGSTALPSNHWGGERQSGAYPVALEITRQRWSQQRGSPKVIHIVEILHIHADEARHCELRAHVARVAIERRRRVQGRGAARIAAR